MILLATLAFAHPDHGDHPGVPVGSLSADDARDLPPPVPSRYPSLINGLREQTDGVESAGKEWRVADLLTHAKTIERYARALPVKAMEFPEAERVAVTERTRSLVGHAEAITSTIATRDLATLQASITAIRADLDALPAAPDTKKDTPD